MFYFDKISVGYWDVWYYFIDEKLVKKMPTWNHFIYWFWFNSIVVYVCDPKNKKINLYKRDFNTKDNITIKVSSIINYEICDEEMFFKKFLRKNGYSNQYSIDLAWDKLQEIFVNLFSKKLIESTSLEISENKQNFINFNLDEINKLCEEFWIKVNWIMISEFSFPKKVQDLFNAKLQANINSQVDLENARTAIATARALKNASKMLSEEDWTKFLYYLETLTKIANSWWKHSFYFGNNEIK